MNVNEHPDRFNGQYPKPAPLPDNMQHEGYNLQTRPQPDNAFNPPFTSNQDMNFTGRQSMPAQPASVYPTPPMNDFGPPASSNQNFTRHSHPSNVTMPLPHMYSTPGRNEYTEGQSYLGQQQHTMAENDEYAHGADIYNPQHHQGSSSFTVIPMEGDHSDSQAVSLAEYVPPDPKNYSQSSSHIHSEHYREDSLEEESDQTPMVRSDIEAASYKTKSTKPQSMGPVPAPETFEKEKETYKHNQDTTVVRKRHMSCCAGICLFFSVLFLLAGVALMIASKVIQDKCPSECKQSSDQASSSASQACSSTICSDVMHEGMLYGGAAVAAISALSILWRTCAWACSGRPRR